MISYDIMTKELRCGKPRVTLAEIKPSVSRFLGFARRHPQLDFEVSAIGCGLPGCQVDPVAPFFEAAPANVLPPAPTLAALEERRTTRTMK